MSSSSLWDHTEKLDKNWNTNYHVHLEFYQLVDMEILNRVVEFRDKNLGLRKGWITLVMISLPFFAEVMVFICSFRLLPLFEKVYIHGGVRLWVTPNSYFEFLDLSLHAAQEEISQSWFSFNTFLVKEGTARRKFAISFWRVFLFSFLN